MEIFPQVWRQAHDGKVAIVYQKRVEYYGAEKCVYPLENDECFVELARLKGAGYKRVHDSDEHLWDE